MNYIERIGLVLFLCSFILFLGCFFMSDHMLTDDVLKATVKPAHYDALADQLDPVIGERYATNFAFAGDVKQAITEVNNHYKAAGEHDKVIYDNYAFALTMNSTRGPIASHNTLLFWLTFVLGSIAGIIHFLPKIETNGPAGIKNNGIFHNKLNSRGWMGIALGVFLIIFYVVLYFTPEYMTNWVLLTAPFKHVFSDGAPSQWFLYGTLYTLAIMVMGVRMAIKYRHSKYQLFRTASVTFFQLGFAFILPEILATLQAPASQGEGMAALPSYDLKNIWPLDYSLFYDYRLDTFQATTVGKVMLGWSIGLMVLGVPLMTYFFGKRWYCSWVCGCGGLAETAGDPFRHLSDKRLSAWKIERYLVHGVLAYAIVMTIGVVYSYLADVSTIAGLDVNTWFRYPYGLLIGSVFAGVVGTGFYPLMGNRVWCRFGCPLAAYLGLVQRFKSRFRITTNGGQCISCGNCSTYCEMGIDVRWYAQRGQNIVRSSCVGCGVCSSVCPRGVLNLENGPENKNRFKENPSMVGLAEEGK